MDLHELINRGRFVMADAPERLRVFELVNGKRSAKEIAKLTRRGVESTLNDLRRLSQVGLLQKRIVGDKAMKKDDSRVYEKDPLARAIPLRYFSEPTRIPTSSSKRSRSAPAPSRRRTRGRPPAPLPIPSETVILDLAKRGEDQLFEFKGQGTPVQKIAREIAAMSNSEQGGIVLYGIADDGTIEGSEMPQQRLDQPLQNCINHTIDPPAIVKLHTVRVTGSPIIVIIVSPWNRRDVHQYDGRILLRKGTNVFAATAREAQRLYNGEVVI